ncbi:phospholipid transport system substrate-binding protein [Sphingomonas sp. PP-CE-3A-406]|uniref:ABC transporter substrate-binding protein n=1 Tax=Sphingomonas sp. PP-CE-3A-406 TaxID=2135659 RepID=UPI000EF91F78|nr:ABC transporter substrate-binding protein [Sphingomonas sp. PP-CE-3A-406]RMB54944.1 phospholipid transport system substrate-binding protein [Sphingomonas sp. PP-CE-3A-406]
MRSPLQILLSSAVLLPSSLVAVAPVSAQAGDPAQAPVKALDDGLLGIMKSGKPAAARATAIGPVIDRSFDLPLMTRLSVGAGWTTASAADQTALVAAFRRMTIAQYAKNFDSWSGQAFTMDPRVDTRGGDRLVRTTLSSKSGSPTALSYRLRQSGGSWKIIDVFYRNSISQLATRRADFASVLQSGGAKALVGHLDSLAAKSAR